MAKIESAKVETLRIGEVKGFTADPARSYNLPASYYTSPAVYEYEKEKIFSRSWIYVGHKSQVAAPGDYFTAEVGEQNIIIIKGKDGQARAFYNVCPHRAHELLKGEGNAKVVTCPYHAWSFHADGRLRTARGCEKVADFNKDEFCLKEVRLEEFCTFLFVNLDPDAIPFREQTGDLEAEIRALAPDLDNVVLAHRCTYDIKANWKNVMDNWLECYHCPPAHPAFAEMVDIKGYRSVPKGIYSTHRGPVGSADNKAYKVKSDQFAAKYFVGWFVYPNVTFNVFPGCPNVTIYNMMPTGPQATHEYLDFLLPQKTPTEEEMAAIKYLDDVLQTEDIGLVESVQRGLNSRGYNQSRYVVDAERSDQSEHALHHFHSLVLKSLEG